MSLRSSISTFLVSTLLASSALPGWAALSLSDVFDRVEEANFQVLIGRELVVEAEQRRLQQRSNLLPELDLNANQIRSRGQLGRGGFGGAADEGGEPIDVASNRNVDTFTAGLGASWTVFDVRRIADYRLARLDQRLGQLNLETSIQDNLARAGFAYLVHLRNLSSLEVIRSNIARAESLLELARNQFASGIATEIDVIRARSILAAENRALLEQKILLLESAMELQQLLNIELTGSIELAGMPVVDPSGDTEGVTVNSTFFRSLPLVEREETIQDQNRLARRAAGYQRLPSLRLFGDYGLRSETAFDGREQTTWSYGASVSVPLFEGFRFRADRRQADSRIRRQDLVLRELDASLRSNLMVVLDEVVSRYEQIRLAEEQRELARSELALAQTRFRRGITDNREVVEAQNNLARAEDIVVGAIFNYNLARLDLARLKGDVRLLIAGN